MPIRVHLLGIPHNRTDPAFSSCAFSQKVVKAIPMLRAQGCEVHHYGVGNINPGADTHTEVMDVGTQADLLGYDPGADPQKFAGDDAHVDHPVYRLFNARVSRSLHYHVSRGDIVWMPFGHGHAAGVRNHRGINLEAGVGYPICCEPFRVYESNAWYAWHMGNGKESCSDYQWVIPNYFDLADWELGTGPRRYLAYFGRMIETKGLAIVREIARSRPDLEVLLAGQGDATPWLSPDLPNLRHIGALVGRARSEFLGGAVALLAPTRYLEPFGGVTVEANLCGTPALTSPFGVFPETIVNAVNGFRCHTLGDYLAAIENFERNPPVEAHIREWAEQRYSLDVIGPRYIRVFEQLRALAGRGWYTHRSVFGPITKAKELTHGRVLESVGAGELPPGAAAGEHGPDRTARGVPDPDLGAGGAGVTQGT